MIKKMFILSPLIKDLLLLFLLFIGNVLIKNYNIYFLLVYASLIIYHIYIYISIKKKNNIQFFSITNYILITILLFLLTYFFICDSNPFFCIFVFYSFFPNFIKAVLIIIIHTYIINIYQNNIKNNNKIYLMQTEEISVKFNIKSDNCQKYFLSDFFIYIRKRIKYKNFSILLIIFILTEKLLFFNRIYLWVFFTKKEKALPNLTSKNTKYYITSNTFNMGKIMDNYLIEMKKLINYLGEQNVIVSFVDNGDSTDNTRDYLEEFQKYLNEKKIVNKFILTHEIDDPRKKQSFFPFLKYTPLRIEYYAQLRNKCLELLYELENIDYNNTIILFFNDVVFKYEDIINLLSTNNEDYDVVCGLDMSFLFYDRWVSIDLEGEGMSKYFPYFLNKEGQDLVINHKPVRVFSCWNGVIAFKASPLENKKVQFRHKLANSSLPKNILTNQAKTYFESECTYFNIDLYSLGYTKKFINPDVRVAYEYYYLIKSKYYIPSFKHIANFFWTYFVSLRKKRNKFMSNYEERNISLNNMIKNWYIENSIHDS